MILSTLLLVLITAGALAWMRRAPAWLFGWLWFLGTLSRWWVSSASPAQHRRPLHVRAHDRPAHRPGVELARHPPRTTRRLLGLAGVLALAGCALRTRAQLPYWQTSEALFARALAVTERNHVMLSNLARVRILQGRTEEANRMCGGSGPEPATWAPWSTGASL